MTQAPFTTEEEKVFSKVSSLFTDFETLFQSYYHPSDRQEYINAIHALQTLVVSRCARREWPGTLASWNQKPKEAS